MFHASWDLICLDSFTVVSFFISLIRCQNIPFNLLSKVFFLFVNIGSALRSLSGVNMNEGFLKDHSEARLQLCPEYVRMG